MAKNQLTEQKQTFSNYIAQPNIKNWLNGLLGNPVESQKFISSMTSAVSTNPALQECDYGTVISSALLANALNLSLSPQLGLCYIVPFEDRKNNRKVATFILGYKGYIQLAIRSGLYRKLNVLAIKDGELINYDPLNEEIEVKLIEDDEEREKTPTIGYYAMFEHINGFKKAMYWSKKKMEQHADKYSKAFKLDSLRKLEAGKIPSSELWKYSSFWYQDFDGMASKTMIRQLISKWGIMSLDLQKGIENDSDYVKDDTSFVTDMPVTSPIASSNEPTEADYMETDEVEMAEQVDVTGLPQVQSIENTKKVSKVDNSAEQAAFDFYN